MEIADLINRFPRLFHMAEPGTWPSIQQHGLLSTCGLLDLFGIKGKERKLIETCQRPESVRISHPEYGSVVIRDQKPLSDKALVKCLQCLTPTEWYKLLNKKVFFWLSEDRLVTLLRALAYRIKSHCV